MPRRRVIVDHVETHPFGPFRIEQAKLRVLSSGDVLTPMTRISFERGNSVAVLAHHRSDDYVVLTRQFRYPALKGAAAVERAWMLELPAGSQETGETAEECARRETEEEVGLVVGRLTPISTFFVSPGGTSERVSLFYAEVDGIPRGVGGGNPAEGEDIEVVHVKVGEFLDMIRRNEIEDAKTIVGGLWLQAHIGLEIR